MSLKLAMFLRKDASQFPLVSHLLLNRQCNRFTPTSMLYNSTLL